MFYPAQVLARSFGEFLAEGYRSVFGHREPDHAPTIQAVAQLAIERISSSDALYHDAQHTMHVTLVGQAIMRGKIMVEEVQPEDWLHYTIATLCHDIGYLRGICPGDSDGRYVIAADGTTIAAPRGISDAYLAPYHVERGKLFVRHRCRQIRHLDVDRVARAIELTRFPVPETDDHAETDTEAGLVRAADLIGQLGDPDHPRKINALFYEFAETGLNQKFGYASPADLADQYPKFFWSKVEPYVRPAIRHLERTVEGKLWVAQLYAHVFIEEHGRRRLGPERGPENDEAAPEPVTGRSATSA